MFLKIKQKGANKMSIWSATGNKDDVNGTFEVADSSDNRRDLNNHEWGASHWTKDSKTGEVLARREDGKYEPSLFQW